MLFFEQVTQRVCQDAVHLGTLAVAIERQRWRKAPMDTGFDDLRDHPGFEDRSPQRMMTELLRLANAQSGAICQCD